MVLALDVAVKTVTDKMMDLGMWENTLFIFQTDNGGNLKAAGNNWPLRGGKYTLFEGGTRGTAFIGGPVLPESVRGTTSTLMMHEVDWMPTILAAIGQVPSNTVDGVSQWEALLAPTTTTNVAAGATVAARAGDGVRAAGAGDGAAPRTQFIYNIDPCAVNHPSPAHIANVSAIRIGDWKYIYASAMPPDVWMPQAWVDPATPSLQPSKEVTTGPFLFNLLSDPEERNNLYASNPTKVAVLHAALAAAAAAGLVWPLNCPGEPGAVDAPMNVTCPNGVWRPWLN